LIGFQKIHYIFVIVPKRHACI